VKFKKYDVTLRRDVQQKIVFRVEASSHQNAINTAEAAATTAHDHDWQIEKFIGMHRSKIDLASKASAARKHKPWRLR
jgi:hypothetical protein